MNQEKLKVTLDSFYVYCSMIENMPCRNNLLKHGQLVVRDESFEIEQKYKEEYYAYIRELLKSLTLFLQDFKEEAYVQQTLTYMQEKQKGASFGITYAPATMKDALEIAYAKYTPVDFFNAVEMTIYDPILRILHHLYKSALGTAYKAEYDLIFKD